MNMRVPDEIPEHWKAEEMDRVLRSLADAGWLRTGEMPAILEVHYSEKGKSAMLRLSALLKRHLPAPSAPGAEPVSEIFYKTCLGPLRVAPEMFSLLFNDRETNAFIALVIAFALENQRSDGS
jgi:hypothetical protein